MFHLKKATRCDFSIQMSYLQIHIKINASFLAFDVTIKYGCDDYSGVLRSNCNIWNIVSN